MNYLNFLITLYSKMKLELFKRGGLHSKKVYIEKVQVNRL